MEVRNINVRFVFTYKYETCDAQFTVVRSNLSTHMKYQHQGVKHPCGLCDYHATQKSHLSRHNHADQMTKLN